MAPVPEAGVTPQSVGTAEVPGVQVPSCTKPVLEELLAANRYTFCCAVNVLVKPIAYFTVRLLPDETTELPRPDNTHWLLETEAFEPGVSAADSPLRFCVRGNRFVSDPLALNR